MASELTITPSLEKFQEAATIWRKELLYQPIIGIQNTLQYMTPRPGVRYRENVGTLNGTAQFAPYKASRATDVNLEVDYRSLSTYLGSVHAKFEPNIAASTILGHMAATKGDGQMQAPSALAILTMIAKGLSENLEAAVWSAERDATGDTTMDLFDGFDTITDAEITAENIAAAKGNYMKLEEEITAANALDVAKEILYSLDPRLRAQELNMYCSIDFADKYNEAMLLTHGGVNFYNEFTQNTVEGSNGRLHIVPMFNKADSKYIHIAPKDNMLVGFDQMGDIESVMVKEYEPFRLSYIATMFFGVQFESIDKRRFKVIELAD